MTKELKSLNRKELEAYQNAVSVLAKIFDLTDEDIDTFFSLVKNAKVIGNAIKSLDKRVENIERAVTKEVDIRNKEIAQKAYNALNVAQERIKL